MLEILSFLLDPTVEIENIVEHRRAMKERAGKASTVALRKSHFVKSGILRTIPHDSRAQEYYLSKREKMIALMQLVIKRAKKERILITRLFSLHRKTTKGLEVIDREITDLLIQLKTIGTDAQELVTFYEKYNSKEMTDPFDRDFHFELKKRGLNLSQIIYSFENTVKRFKQHIGIKEYEQKVLQQISSPELASNHTLRRLLTTLNSFVVFTEIVSQKTSNFVDMLMGFLNEGEIKESREEFNKIVKRYNEKAEYYQAIIGPIIKKINKLIEGKKDENEKLISKGLKEYIESKYNSKFSKIYNKGNIKKIQKYIDNLTEIRGILITLYHFLGKNSSELNSNTFTQYQVKPLLAYVQHLFNKTSTLENKDLIKTLNKINPYLADELRRIVGNINSVVKKLRWYMEFKKIS